MHMFLVSFLFFSFFFNDTATTEIYTLSLHDALPICELHDPPVRARRRRLERPDQMLEQLADRKSTRLNSSHVNISYAVFFLKKKNSRVTVMKMADVAAVMDEDRAQENPAAFAGICAEDPVMMVFFFFNATATTEIYTLSLHDALPISRATTSSDRSARSCAAPRSARSSA